MPELSPLVSVVLPVRDGGKYLAEAVQSILSQSYTRIELILIDDHSQDNALLELATTDPRLTVHSSTGSGVVSAFNTGFDLSNGEFIARMDADDISLPQRISSQLNFLSAHQDIDIAGCRVDIFSLRGIAGGLQRYQAWVNSVCEPEQVHRQIFIESPLPNPGIMFRRSALEKLQGYRDLAWPEDYDLLLRADALGLRMGKPEPVLLRWREHENRLTHTDQRYQRKQFMQAKAHFLVQHRLRGQAVIIWGAGPTGRIMHDLLIEQGATVSGFLEVHPRRIGGKKRGLPVWPIEQVRHQQGEMILVAVGAAGARQEIGEFMLQHGKTEGRDFLFVA
jgi:glycosyltransferase involved in cell wall biosynthesis